MLSKRENFIECVEGGTPDRYVNQFEAIIPMAWGDPHFDFTDIDEKGQSRDEWGVLWQCDQMPGAMPLNAHVEDRVIKDIEDWRSYFNPPSDFDDPAIWADAVKTLDEIDEAEVLRTVAVIPGIFERLHDMCEIAEVLAAFYGSPDEIHELIDAILEVELKRAEAICKYLKPEVLYHHDDWGTMKSTFMAPEMFEEFLLEPNKKLYSYYKEHGVKYIIHHSDAYGGTLVPYMIEMGVDIWQGALSGADDLKKIVHECGDQLTIMGGIDDYAIDKPDWTAEEVTEYVNKVIDEVDSKIHFIPCISHGEEASVYEGCYDAISAAIDKKSEADFS